MLGFVKRHFKDLNSTAIKTLYTSLIHSHLEYASIILNPVFNIDILTIEKVQYQFYVIDDRKDIIYKMLQSLYFIDEYTLNYHVIKFNGYNLFVSLKYQSHLQLPHLTLHN